jgi:preprotein translocase subunit SecB
MKITKSPLVQTDFFVLNCNYNFIEPTEESTNITETFSNYKIDFDFAHKLQENGQIYIFVKVEINNVKNALPGYKMFIEGVSIFEINEAKIVAQKQKEDLIHISGLSIAINNIRSYIDNLTMYNPLGKYSLPVIDLAALYKEKNKKIKKNKSTN